MNKELQEAVDDIVRQFAIDQEHLVKASEKFNESMDAGLRNASGLREYMPMIPSFVTLIPTGKEVGLYLAADLGGTNFRVCSINLNGDHTFSMKQSKSPIPLDLMANSTAQELFAYLAGKIESFLKEHHSDYSDDAPLKLGFTFSFPVDQTALGAGKLIRWTKGFNLPDCVGKDIVALLQENVDRIGTKVKIVALANDTVGTLLSRAYSNDVSKTRAHTVIGAIFGTGTNGAYLEPLANIKKLNPDIVFPEGTTGMVVNTEWGSFDNTLKILHNTKYDQIIDAETSNPGYHLFEKRISGMFLGELLRVILIDLFERGLLFNDLFAARGGSLPHRLSEPWQLSSEVLSYLQIDDSTDLKMSQLILENHLRLPTTKEERLVIQKITQTVAHRAAYLSAIPLAAILARVKGEYTDDWDFEVGCDGSVVEFYPGFQAEILKAIALIDPLEGSTKKIHIRIAKDGSGVGAALCASQA